jgi:hypothetical protein
MDAFTSRVAQRYFRKIYAMSYSQALGVLGLSPGATESDVKKAWTQLAFKNHPDRGGDATKMVEINVAKDVLLGKQRATPDYRADPPPPPPPPQEEPKKQEKVVTTFAEAEAHADIPSGTVWKFKTDTVFGKGLDSSSTGSIYYGQTDTLHVFTAMQHKVSQNFFTGLDRDEWFMWTNKFSKKFSHDLVELGLRVIKDMYGDFDSDITKKFNGKVRLLPDVKDLHPADMWNNSRAGRAMSYKDAMVMMEIISADDPQVAKRKLSVVLEATQSIGMEFGYKDTLTFYINGKKFGIKEQNVRMVKDHPIHIFKLVFGANYFDKVKKDLTRSRAGKTALLWFAENLIGEPQELIDLLKQAADQKK